MAFLFILFVLNLIPYFPIDNFDQVFLSLMESLLPNESSSFFHDIFIDINSNKRSGLLSTTLIFSIILIGNGVNAVFEGFRPVMFSFLEIYLNNISMLFSLVSY